MRSMTGFAQRRFSFTDFSIYISMKSLNHRYLDVTFKGSGITPASEKLIKEIITEQLFRGKVEIIFDLFEYDPKKWNIQLNEYLLEDILEKLMNFKRKYKNNLSLSLDSLLKIPMVFHLDYIFDNFAKKEIKEIKTAIKKVFNDFIQSRAEEGEFILKNLISSLDKIENYLKAIEEHVSDIENELVVKYREKIARFLAEIEIDERRIAQEAAILSEKACITEEVNRLKIHKKRLKELLLGKDTGIKGKEADFLTQEMLREIHTISSKTSSMEVHKTILLVRREIEKIKQQIQNVE